MPAWGAVLKACSPSQSATDAMHLSAASALLGVAVAGDPRLVPGSASIARSARYTQQDSSESSHSGSIQPGASVEPQGSQSSSSAQPGSDRTFARFSAEGDVAQRVLPQPSLWTIHNCPVLVVAGADCLHAARNMLKAPAVCHAACHRPHAVFTRQPSQVWLLSHRSQTRAAPSGTRSAPPTSFSFTPVNLSSSTPLTAGPVTLVPASSGNRFCGAREHRSGRGTARHVHVDGGGGVRQPVRDASPHAYLGGWVGFDQPAVIGCVAQLG